MALASAKPGRKPPRFPYVAALLCAACLGAAGWTWMRYSYAWDLTPSELASRKGRTTASMFVRVRGRAGIVGNEEDYRGIHTWELRVSDAGGSVNVLLPGPDAPMTGEGEASYCGRVSRNEWGSVVGPAYLVDARTSRLHGASVAGLLVGAMGVFAFGVALRHWLNRRRAFHVETAEAAQ